MNTEAMRVNESLPSYTVRIRTPDGVLFATIAERDSVPVRVDVTIGKAGSGLGAWCAALSALATRILITSDQGIYAVIEELSQISSDRIEMNDGGVVCRSGPQGVALALQKYRGEKFSELEQKRKKR